MLHSSVRTARHGATMPLSRPMPISPGLPELCIRPAALLTPSDVGTGHSFPVMTPSPLPLGQYRKVSEDLQQSKRQISRLQRENEGLQARNHELCHQHERLKRRHSSMVQEYEALQTTHAEVRACLSERDRKMETAKASITHAQQQTQHMQQRAAHAEASVAQLLQDLDAAKELAAEAEQRAAEMRSEADSAEAVVRSVCGERQLEYSRSMELAARLSRLSNTVPLSACSELVSSARRASAASVLPAALVAKLPTSEPASDPASQGNLPSWSQSQTATTTAGEFGESSSELQGHARVRRPPGVYLKRGLGDALDDDGLEVGVSPPPTQVGATPPPDTVARGEGAQASAIPRFGRRSLESR